MLMTEEVVDESRESGRVAMVRGGGGRAGCGVLVSVVLVVVDGCSYDR